MYVWIVLVFNELVFEEFFFLQVQNFAKSSTIVALKFPPFLLLN